MKRLRRYTALVCMFLVLCMLPAAAGAARLDKSELHFTVGKKDSQYVDALLDPGDEDLLFLFNSTKFREKELPKLAGSGLTFSLQTYDPEINGERLTFSGTPLVAGEYDLKYYVLIDGFNGYEYTLPLKIIVHAKQQVTPVVDDVVYNAAAYHERALICEVREWCNVRAGAGTQHEVVGRANLGQQISLLCWNEDESWCYVEFDGMEGWIAKQFILPIQ